MSASCFTGIVHSKFPTSLEISWTQQVQCDNASSRPYTPSKASFLLEVAWILRRVCYVVIQWSAFPSDSAALHELSCQRQNMTRTASAHILEKSLFLHCTLLQTSLLWEITVRWKAFWTNTQLSNHHRKEFTSGRMHFSRLEQGQRTCRQHEYRGHPIFNLKSYERNISILFRCCSRPL